MRVNHTRNLEQAVERIVQPYVSKRKHAVLSVGILRGGERLVFGFGDLRPYGGVSCDQLIYEIGSITKVFTTSLLALLIAEGVLRRKFRYSNEGTGLLGRLLTEWLGTDYETAIIERLCLPLHLPDTVLSLTRGQKARMLPGYAGKDVQRPETLLQDYAGAGALRSTLNDQLTFLAAHLGDHSNEVLCQDLLISQQTYARHSKTISVGLGWIIDERGKFVWHNGSTHGFSSFMGFLQDQSSGIVVLSNYRSGLLSDSVDRIGLELLDRLKKS